MDRSYSSSGCSLDARPAAAVVLSLRSLLLRL